MVSIGTIKVAIKKMRWDFDGVEVRQKLDALKEVWANLIGS